MSDTVVVVDNGACKCRMGLAGESAPRVVFQNAAAKCKGDNKFAFGSEIDQLRNINQLNVKRAHDRGYLVNWPLEVGIWSRMLEQHMPTVCNPVHAYSVSAVRRRGPRTLVHLHRLCALRAALQTDCRARSPGVRPPLAAPHCGRRDSAQCAATCRHAQACELIYSLTGVQVSTQGASLVMTEPLFNLPAIRRTTLQIVFEQFGFQSFHCDAAPVFALHKWAADRPGDAVARSLSGVVLDAGYSFTHAVPVFDGRVQQAAVRRIRLGGKLLTNLMKEWVRAPRS